jgi:hypothetical protein
LLLFDIPVPEAIVVVKEVEGQVWISGVGSGGVGVGVGSYGEVGQDVFGLGLDLKFVDLHLIRDDLGSLVLEGELTVVEEVVQLLRHRQALFTLILLDSVHSRIRLLLMIIIILVSKVEDVKLVWFKLCLHLLTPSDGHLDLISIHSFE